MKTLINLFFLLSTLNISAQTYGTNSVDWGLNGNRVNAHNYIGTKNNHSLKFKTNNQLAGYFHTDKSLFLMNVPHSSSIDSVLIIVGGQVRKAKYTPSGGGGGGSYNVINGLHLSDDTIKLGGDLIENTRIRGISGGLETMKNFTIDYVDTLKLSSFFFDVWSRKTSMVSQSNTYIGATTNSSTDTLNRTAIEINGIATGAGDCSPVKETAIGVNIKGNSTCYHGTVIKGYSSAPGSTIQRQRIGLLLNGTHSGAAGFTGTGIGIEIKGSKDSNIGNGADILINPVNQYLKIDDVINDYAMSLYGKNANGYMVNVQPYPYIANPTNESEDRAAIIAILDILRSIRLLENAP